jgi:hypothetical protein
MANRKSMNDAMTLNPEKLAFIHGRDKASREPRKEQVKTNAPEIPELAATGAEPKVEEPSAPVVRRGRKPKAASRDLELSSEFNEPDSEDAYQAIWVPLTTRLSPATSEALRRTALELRLKRRRPQTQQEIVEAALRHWLKANGFGQAA